MTEQKNDETLDPKAMELVFPDDLDSIVPGGAQGGVIARARRAAAKTSRPTVARSRARVRMTFQAVEIVHDEAA